MAKKRSSRRHERRYTEKMLYDEREYGMFWYAWLWKVLRPVMALLCALAITGGLVVTGWNALYEQFFSPVDMENKEAVSFEIESGSSITTIGKHLYDEGLLRNRGIFGYIIQFRGLTSSIQYGTYELSPSMNVLEIIDVLSSGSAVTERTITIIPGWTVEDIAEYLVSEGALDNVDEFLTLCNSPAVFSDDNYILRDAYENRKTEGSVYALEGLLAPDTYRVFTTASAQSIISKLLKQTDSVANAVFYAESTSIAYDENGQIIDIVDETPKYETTLSQYETWILASIIEKEAGQKSDYALVSAVFHNRLNQGMSLGSDATVKYVLGYGGFVLDSNDLSVESMYNTYTNKGLPPGPICNPSKAAIEAALYPDMDYISQGYLYFCSKEPESGELVFAKTLKEHEANVAKYKPSWIEYDKTHNQ